METSIQSMGGKATAIKLRREALEKYYSNPNKCLHCGSIIAVPDNVKVSSVREKKFCNKSCAAKHNNHMEPKKVKIIKFVTDRDTLKLRAKGELFSNRSNWQSARSAIQKHARTVYDKSGKPKCCSICGYAKHYQVAHIKAVSEFGDFSTVSEINHIDNLIALCPNHHWEYDNNVLDLGADHDSNVNFRL